MEEAGGRRCCLSRVEGTGGGRRGRWRPVGGLTFRGSGMGSELRRTEAREDSEAEPAPVASLPVGELTTGPSAHPALHSVSEALAVGWSGLSPPA